TISDLQEILRSDRKLRTVVKEELEAIKKKFGDERRTQLGADAGEMNLEDLITDEDVVVVRTEAGYIKTVAASKYRTQGCESRGEGFIAINLRRKDELVRVVETSGADDIIIVTRKGMSIRFTESNVRSMGRSAAGVRGIRLKPDDEVVSCDVASSEGSILIVT